MPLSKTNFKPTFDPKFMDGTLDIGSTPIVKYDGPPELRKELEMVGRKFLGYIKGAMGGNLPYNKFTLKSPDGKIIEVQSISNVGQMDIIKITVPPPKGGRKEIVEPTPYKKQRYLIGLEYTDSSHGAHEGSFDNYNGYGMLLGVLGKEKYVPVVSFQWKESVPLKGPWKLKFASGANAIKDGTPESPYPNPTVPYQNYYWSTTASPSGQETYAEFNVKHQGEEEGPYNLKSGDDHIEIVQLDEMDYDQSLYPSLMRKSERRLAQGNTDGVAEYYNRDEMHYTTWIEVAGEMIAGPFTRVVGSYTRIQVTDDENHHRGQEDFYQYGEEISSIAGMVLKEGVFICLYNKYHYNECNRYVESESVNATGHITDDGSDLTVDVYTGSLDEYPLICCSGATYEIPRTPTDMWSSPWGSEGTTGLTPRCVRIFGHGTEIPDDPSKLFYLYSFWQPQLNPSNPDEDNPYTLEPVMCRYGYVHGFTNITAEQGYSTIIGEDDYYSHDNNTVPGMPTIGETGEKYCSSILMRIYLETITGEKVTTKTIDE
jgi:hypothetical protein